MKKRLLLLVALLICSCVILPACSQSSATDDIVGEWGNYRYPAPATTFVVDIEFRADNTVVSGQLERPWSYNKQTGLYEVVTVNWYTMAEETVYFKLSDDKTQLVKCNGDGSHDDDWMIRKPQE